MAWINENKDYNGGDQQLGETYVPDRPSHLYAWNDIEWVLKPPVVPQEVTRAQAKHALLNSGFLDAVETLVPTLGRAAQIDWADRPTIRRTHAFVIETQARMGWTDAQVDGLFILAASL